MIKHISLAFAFSLLTTLNAVAQEVAPQEISTQERFGNTLNLGAGVGYYGYLGNTLPVGIINYELNVARNFTLAPFVGVYTYKNHTYWGDPGKPDDDPSYHLYSYRAIAVPVGVKGTYYFDQLLKAHSDWDFYAAGSAGVLLRSVVWESGYGGDKHLYPKTKPLYLDVHLGAEYHINQKAGIFLDLSSGVSTFGLAIHF